MERKMYIFLFLKQVARLGALTLDTPCTVLLLSGIAQFSWP